MAGTGPAPSPSPRRRNATVAMTKLPAAGRQGPPPRWPLHDDVTLTARYEAAQRRADDLELQLKDPDITGRRRTTLQNKLDAAQLEANILSKKRDAQRSAEAEMWQELWATPQAAAWERMGWVREVAQYVRWKVQAEMGDLEASKEARMLADRLGLNPLAMLRLRWEVSADEVAAQRAAREVRPGRDPRKRLRAAGDE